jgi:hypothetical protein
MRLRPAFVFLTGMFAFAFQLMAAGTASAYFVGLTAAAECDTNTGALSISYTATSWGEHASASNPQIDILFNNVVVDSQPFVLPTNSFSGSKAAPAGAGGGSVVSVTAVAVGAWGDGFPGGQSSSVSVVLPESPCVQPGLGRFTGGGFQVRVGAARVSRGLTIHCDLLLSNNLEVNWGGNQFHMTEHLSTVACTDDPAIIQDPPPAPLDTLIGVGAGRYNGVDGYTIAFTLVDGGEPGTVVDKAALLIYETANPANVVLDVPLQPLSGGNLQAHYDQPHK